MRLKIYTPILMAVTFGLLGCAQFQKSLKKNSAEKPPVETVTQDTTSPEPATPKTSVKTEKPVVAYPVLNDTTDLKLTDRELQKYAYELGLDPQGELSQDDLAAIAKRRKVRRLERRLDSQKERLNYSKVVPLLENDDEKISYLSIPSIEGRQAWVNKNKIWQRSKPAKDFQDLMEQGDIAAGMSSDLVVKSWGEPENVEYSGNPIYKNERWKYLKQVPTPNGFREEKRTVYFEGGRVVGWETE